MAGPRVSIEITGDTKGLSRAFDDAGRAGDGFGSSMAKIGKIAAVGLAVGIGAAAYATKGFIEAALDAEKSQLRLDSAFKKSGATVSEQETAMKALNDISVKSGLDDEALADSLAKLTLVTGDTATATTDLGLAADIARGRGISLEAATALVTKAALGNVGAMKRMGIEIPPVTTAMDALKESHVKATAEQIKAAKEADNLSTRQAALAGLQAKFGGAAEEYGKSASGAMDRFKVSIENVQEGLGQALLPALAKVAGGVADFLDKFNNASGASAKFKVVIDEIKLVAGQAWTALQQAFAAINWGQVWDTVSNGIRQQAGKLQQAMDNIDWAGLARKAQAELNKALDNLTIVVKQIKWPGLSQSISNAISSSMSGVDWPGMIVRFLKFDLLTLKVYAELVAKLTAGLIQGVVGAVAKAGGQFTKLSDGLGYKITNGIVAGMSGIAAAVTGKLDNARQAVANAAQNVYGNALAIGKQIVSGILDGITSLPGQLASKLGGFIRSGISAAGKALHGSGDFQFTRHVVGAPLAQGVIEGFSEKMGSLGATAVTAMNKLGADIVGAMNKTNAELKRISDQRAAQDRQAAVASAEAQLREAEKSGKGIAEARRTLARAVQDIQIADAQAQVTKAQTMYDNLMDKHERYRARFEASWAKLSEAALSAWDKRYSGMQTAAERELALIERTEAEKSRQEELAAARSAVNAATTDAERLAAQERVRKAELAIRVAGLQEQAEAERKGMDGLNETQRAAFEKKLAALEKSLEKRGATEKQAHAAILKLYASFGLDYQKAGADMGQAVVNGLASKVAAANAEKVRLTALTAEMAALNPSGVIGGGNSGVFAPTNPLTDAEIAALNATTTPRATVSTTSVAAAAPSSNTSVSSGMNYIRNFASGGLVKGGRGGLIARIGEARHDELVTPLRGGGIGNNITINLPAYLGEKREIVELFRQELYRIQNRNGSLGFT